MRKSLFVHGFCGAVLPAILLAITTGCGGPATTASGFGSCEEYGFPCSLEVAFNAAKQTLTSSGYTIVQADEVRPDSTVLRVDGEITVVDETCTITVTLYQGLVQVHVTPHDLNTAKCERILARVKERLPPRR